MAVKILDITIILFSFLLGGVIATFLFGIELEFFFIMSLGSVGYYFAIVVPVWIRIALEGKGWG